MPFLSNSGRAFLCCRDTVLPLHSGSGMHPFMEAIWRFDTITLYWQLEQMAKRDCVEIRERCKRQLSQEGRDAQKEGRRGFQQSFLHGKKCGKTKRTVYTVTVFYNNRKVIGSRTNARPQKG